MHVAVASTVLRFIAYDRPPLGSPASLVLVSLTERGYARGSTRRGHSGSGPGTGRAEPAAATAAVSARRTVGPRPTPGPIGPLVRRPTHPRDRRPAPAGAARGALPRARPGPGGGRCRPPARPGPSSRRTPRASQARRLWAAASRATRRRRSTARSPRSPSQRTTERADRTGTIRSTPSSVSFWVTHSGRSPLVGTKADGERRARRRRIDRRAVDRQDRFRVGLLAPRPVPGRPPPGTAPSARPRRKPPPAPRAGAGARRAGDGRRRQSTTGVARSSTKTMAAAPTRTGSGPGRGPAPTAAPPGSGPRRTAVSSRAERSLEKSPSLCGASPSSSPRASARAASSSRCWSSRSVGVSTCTWTNRSPRPRPRSFGHAQPLERDHRPALGAGGDRQVPGVVQGLEGDAPAQGGQRQRHVDGGVEVHAGALEPAVGRHREVDEQGPVRARPGSRPGRGRPAAASTRRPPRPGCRRSGSGVAFRRPSPRQASHGLSTDCPVPWQRPQGTAVITWPRMDWRTRRSSPVPWQSGQRTAVVPGRAPDPSHVVAVHRRLDVHLALARRRPPPGR